MRPHRAGARGIVGQGHHSLRHLSVVTTLLALAVAPGCFLFSTKPTTCELPPAVIDAHGHLFNARYLPICEIAVAYDVPPTVAKFLEDVALSLTGDSQLAEVTTKAALDEATQQAELTAEKFLSWLSLPDAQARQEIIKELFSAQLRTKQVESLEERNAVREYLGSLKVLNDGSSPLTPEEIARAFEKAGIIAHDHDQGDALAAKSLNLAGYLRFLYVVTRAERDILRIFQKTYPGVSLLTHHMMDMERTYAGQIPTFAFDRQVDKMLALQAENPGGVLTFGAFDPFRRKDALAHAQEQHRKGVTGFKFYPPSGYRPGANEIPDITFSNTKPEHWEGRYGNLTADDLNTLNDRFFAWCAENDVPIFVHCTPQGFESVKGYGKLMCDPTYWRPILEKYTKLRVCFGHAGGSGLYMDGAADAHSARFGQTVVELIRDFDNVYCEAGFWKEVLEDNGPTRLQSKLRELFTAYPKLRHRLIYGTDWFMLVQEKNHGEYLCQMAKAFEHPELKDLAPHFFAANMARFLKLDELAQRQTLDAATRAQLASVVSKLPEDWKSPGR